MHLARRKLGFTIDEWQALPWWQEDVYVEGFGWEFGPEPDDEGDATVIPWEQAYI